MLRIISFLRIFQGQLKALWRAFWHKSTPFYLKVLMVLVVAYLLMPIDIIPDFLLLFGLIDDVLIIALAVNWIIKRLPKEIFETASTSNQTQNNRYEGDDVTIDGTSRRL